MKIEVNVDLPDTKMKKIEDKVSGSNVAIKQLPDRSVLALSPNRSPKID